MMKVLNKLGNVFYCSNKWVLLTTITISSILPLLIGWGAWVYFPSVFDRIAKYSDFIAGQTAWSGYFKRGDLIMFNIYFISYVVLLVTLPIVLNRFIKARNPERKEGEGFGDATFFLLAFAVFGVVVLLLNRTFPLAAVFAFVTCLYLILHGHGEKAKKSFAKFCALGVFGYFNVIALSVVVLTLFDNPGLHRVFETSMSYILITLVALAILYIARAYAKGSMDDEGLQKIFVASQMFLPTLFIAFYQFRYLHHGITVTQFHSNRLMAVCWIAAIAMIIFNFYRCNHKQKGKQRYADKGPVLLTSMISIAAFIHFRLPHRALNTDFFHAGEQLTPFHQFIQFGAMPYRELIPMHGFINYSAGLFNHLFFGGYYATFSAGSVINLVVLMIVVTLIIRRFVVGEYFPLLAAILVALTDIPGGRELGPFIMILVLHNRDLRNNPISFLWWWIATSIFAIAWNPPLGGVASISFLPLLIFSFIVKKVSLLEMIKTEMANIRNRVAWGILIIIGVAFIPLFITIVQILIANMGSNMEAFGSSGLYALHNGAMNIFGIRRLDIGFTMMVRPLSFMAAVALFLVMLFDSKDDETTQKYINIAIIVQVLIFAFLTSDYGFSRADRNFPRMISGNTALLVGVVFSVGGFLIKNRAKYRYSVWFVPVIIGLAIGGGANNFFTQHRAFFSRPTINDEYVQFDGASAGIANLGTVFTNEGMVARLTNISHVLNGMESYVDWTNNVAYHAIFDKRNPIPLSSFYITQNRSLHYIYLRNMQDAIPELIMLSPAVLHDGRTASLGMYPVWRWTMSQGYVPFRHHDILFLLSEDSQRHSMFEPANYEFENLMHRRYLGFLPINWGSGEIMSNRLVSSGIYLQEISSRGIEDGWIVSDDSWIVYSLDVLIDGFEADFLRISLDWEYDLLDESDFQVFWASEGQEFNEERSLFFKGYNGDMLLPLGSSPRWLLADNLEHIRFEFPDTMYGKTVPRVSLSLYRYNDTYPIRTPTP